MITAVLVLCTIFSLACAGLLLRGWRSSRVGLLFAAAICFFGMAVSHGFRIAEVNTPLTGDLATALIQTPTFLGIIVLVWALIKAGD